MPYHVKEDGTIVADTLEEALAIQRAIKANAQPSIELPSSKTPRRVSDAADGSARRAKAWAADSFREFCETSSAKSREVVAAALKVGNGASSKQLAEAAGSSYFGIGKRIQKVRTEAAKYSRKLPSPLNLVGDGGRKIVQIDASFLSAAQEASSR